MLWTCNIVSLEMVDADVENLKKGLEILQEEQTLDPNNFILFISIYTCICISIHLSIHSSHSFIHDP